MLTAFSFQHYFLLLSGTFLGLTPRQPASADMTSQYDNNNLLGSPVDEKVYEDDGTFSAADDQLFDEMIDSYDAKHVFDE